MCLSRSVILCHFYRQFLLLYIQNNVLCLSCVEGTTKTQIKFRKINAKNSIDELKLLFSPTPPHKGHNHTNVSQAKS